MADKGTAAAVWAEQDRTVDPAQLKRGIKWRSQISKLVFNLPTSSSPFWDQQAARQWRSKQSEGREDEIMLRVYKKRLKDYGIRQEITNAILPSSKEAHITRREGKSRQDVCSRWDSPTHCSTSEDRAGAGGGVGGRIILT